MALIENTIFGRRDKVQIAIDRIRAHEPKEGYWLAFSGGKDSCVIKHLTIKAGVKFDAHYSFTGIDPPEVVKFIEREHKDVIRSNPEKTIWALIVKKRYPPTRRARYCCEWLKERGGEGRMVMTGVRWEDSNKRRNRKMVELCNRTKGKSYLHPIIDWTTQDIWQYIRKNNLPYCSLYDEGFKRLGCIMCPLNNTRDIKKEALRWPQIANAYRAACCRAFDKACADKLPKFLSGDWKDGNDMYDWWLNGGVKKGRKGWFNHDT